MTYRIFYICPILLVYAVSQIMKEKIVVNASFSTTGIDKLFYSALGTRVMPTHNIEQGIMRVISFERRRRSIKIP